ncbi:hypothetical protein ACCC98_18325 [Rhizobium pisi]|uniref:hypothetical protein n=1 Tax=Rhizobium pisi TaxID=574561 RepID=UPI0039AF0C5A
MRAEDAADRVAVLASHPAFSGESSINSIHGASPKRKPRNGLSLAAASRADRQHVIGAHVAESAAAARWRR